ncbi:hypothetical protein SH584_04050 [Sphingomonas sp. LY29]|uniref:hypothetical protein n=1 Tax=Sphingomonas sp. LY29 TaxID=3095341 RepID=UPI002D77D990|nr:hypothetical protein [Sphingomonas sp. LY29]WRP26614.1 hypothetical protein SH584_04050 [Sphingomonas sp. LY29]
MALRQRRVDAFAKWLAKAPHPFHQQPEFRFFKDLSPEEFDAACDIMEAEGDRLEAEAVALRDAASSRGEA